LLVGPLPLPPEAHPLTATAALNAASTAKRNAPQRIIAIMDRKPSRSTIDKIS
jgi:hypothetical protein